MADTSQRFNGIFISLLTNYVLFWDFFKMMKKEFGFHNIQFDSFGTRYKLTQ